MRKYNVYSHDVWSGEEKWTWIKNNSYKIGEIELADDFKDDDIWKALKRVGLSPKGKGVHLKLTDFCGNGTCFEIYRRTDLYPILDILEA